MKIQSTIPTSIKKNKKTDSKQASGAFQSLFSSQIASNATVESTAQDDQHAPQEQAPHPQQQSAIEDALHLLEQAMLKLDEGEDMPEQAVHAIADLRQALKSTDHMLNHSDIKEADTLLAVEAKRLETLNKI